ncbi:N-formylglutamate amidohydrolase [Limnohabitans sp. Rim8]|uniref:N-formylglutamate amidohydrolase n=1 Tax=Limnohabitans sp. Rim8 TaxID=1100718 RepID=UPI00260A02C0|nr:N-formylglutamate amidohydrolase [Limnohabitans sp. Rim8]
MAESSYVLSRPENKRRLPLVCDSPHSGTNYPSDFRSALPFAQLRQTEDTDIDALWAGVPAVGGTLVSALFPRCYIDPNRALEDLDPSLIAGTWPVPLAPGPKSKLGYGLIFSKVDAHNMIYDRQLTVQEIQQRIDHYWQPYRSALDEEIRSSYDAFGSVWHLNLHSMPQNAYERLGIKTDKPLADFVLGDRDGTTCEPAFVSLVEESLRSCGYSVARNDPYKGVALLEQIGQPAQRRHSLQIEIRRPLYMHEASRERNADFDKLKLSLDKTLSDVALYVQSQVGGQKA